MKHERQRKRHTRVVAGLIAFFGLVVGGAAVYDLGSGTAAAADNKVISGHACEPQGDDYYTDRSDPRYLENTGAVQSYMCPVVRDDTTGELDFARVRVDNNTGTATEPLTYPLSCTVHSVSVSGGSQDMEMASTTTAGVQTLEFSLNGFAEYDNGHYVIECVLGPGDRIISYRTAEN